MNASTDPSLPPALAWNRRVRQGVSRYSVAAYLCALILLFVVTPMLEQFEWGRTMELVMVSVMLVTAVPAVGARRRAFIQGMVLVTPAIVARWVHHVNPTTLTDAVAFVSFLVFVGFVIAHFLRFIIRAPMVTSEVLCASLATYLLMALLWAAAYALVSRLSPGAFAGLGPGRPLGGFEAIYFSTITLTTVGYGDIAPVSGVARMLAMLEVLTGTMFITLLVSRLVSLYPSRTGSSPGGSPR